MKQDYLQTLRRHIMRLYLDCCCLNRPFDDKAQDRVRIEIAALEIIMSRVASGEWLLLGSDVLAAEVAAIPDLDRRRAVSAMLLYSKEWVVTSSAVTELAAVFVSAGVDDMDALPLASATMGQADVFRVHLADSVIDGLESSLCCYRSAGIRAYSRSGGCSHGSRSC